MPNLDDPGVVDDAIARLHAAGWSVGSAEFKTGGRVLWVVAGSNGENLIHAEGPTLAEAWLAALEQARAVGMLDGVRPGEPGAG